MELAHIVVIFTFFLMRALASPKNLIVETDLFSDVDDAGALLLAATLPDIKLLGVNVNCLSSFSAVAASAILAHYGYPDIPIGIRRPLHDKTFFDAWHYAAGEYASKVAYHWSGGSIPWGHAEEAWDPVALYRKILSGVEDGSVTIASIGFLDNLSDLLNSQPDAYSPLTGRELVNSKVTELVIMGGGYPSGYSWNFWGSDPSLAAHVIDTWEGRIVFLGEDVGKHVKTGHPLMLHGPKTDPVRMAYIYYTCFTERASWDPLTILYATYGLGDLFKFGNEYGYNRIEANGSNNWVWDENRRNQFFLRLDASVETAAAEVDRLFLEGANKFAGKSESTSNQKKSAKPTHEEL